MGKKSKGRAARRAAAEESRAISFVHGLRDRYTRSLRWEFAACTHGVNPVAIPEGSACRGLIDTFLDAFFDDKANEKFEKTGEVFANAMEQTYESHREVWDSESGRQLIIADLLRRGAEILLRVDSVAKKREADRGRLIGLAGAYATVVDAIETYCPEKARATVWTHPKHPMPGGGFQINPDMSAEEVEEMTLQMTRLGCESKEVGVNACYSYGSKEREKKADSELVSLLSGCERTTLRFFTKRLPCQCLVEMYKAVKHHAKMGLCETCGKEDDRSKLKLCTGCRLKYYCSRECQVKAWKEEGHKDFCNRHKKTRKMKEEQEAKQKERENEQTTETC